MTITFSKAYREAIVVAAAEAWTWHKENTGPSGWYAVVVSWDEDEGLFPSAAHWNGTSWDDQRPIVAFASPFESQAVADAWAYEHDPEL